MHSGGTTAALTCTGAATNVNGARTGATADVTPFAGPSVRLLVEPTDAAAPA